MFFVPLENQLHFLLLTLVPTYMVFTAITWDRTDSPKRLFGLLFISPLLLSIFSFLNAPVHRELAEYLLHAAGLVLVIMAVCAEFAAKNSTASHLGGLASICFPIFFLASDNFLPLAILSLWTPWIIGVSLLLSAALLGIAIAQNRQADAIRLSGNLLICAGILLFQTKISPYFVLASHAILLIGLVTCALAMYRNTFAGLKMLVESREHELKRLDAHVQNEVVKRVASFEKSSLVYKERARTDSLTGLYLKSSLVPLAELHLKRNPKESLSIVMLDIDHFKEVNDTMGHPVGDKCLTALASIARASFRTNDMLGRYGGDEFIFILPSASASIAVTVAERFRRSIEIGSVPKFTVSIGISTYPQDGDNVKALIEAADKALYTSKQGGKNRVTHASEVSA